MEQFAYFLGKLKAIKEGDGTLLDNCMIVMGAGISDGDRHSHDDLPILLAGKARRRDQARPAHPLRRSRRRCATSTCPCSAPMGVKADRFGDSTGRLAGLGA